MKQMGARAVPVAPQIPAARNFAELTPPERLIIWGCRIWVACYKAGKCPMQTLRDVFGRFGVHDAASSLDGILGATARYATRSVDMRCPNCPHLSPDEACLLRAAAAMQRKDTSSAWTIMMGGGWLLPAVVDWAIGPLHGLAILFKNAGWTLPARECGDADEEGDGVTLFENSPGHTCTLH
jgi:hypothetical protein